MKEKEEFDGRMRERFLNSLRACLGLDPIDHLGITHGIVRPKIEDHGGWLPAMPAREWTQRKRSR